MQAQIQRLQELIDNASQNELRQLQEVFFFQQIFGQCSHFIDPENSRKPKVFLVSLVGTLAKNGLRYF